MSDARWRIFRDASGLAEEAAEMVLSAIESGGDSPAICLTGGSSPRRLYDLLGREPWITHIPWSRVHWFVGDERFVPESDERSNMGAARRLFLDRCAPKENIHDVAVDAADVHEAAQRYEADLRDFLAARRAGTLFDLVLLGVGPDGHVASMFPGSSAAKEPTRWVLGVEQAGLAPFVPRISLTQAALASSRNLVFIAEAAEKAPVLARVARGDDLPATRVMSQEPATWLVGAAAAPPMQSLAPRVILVMGVSGSGKTTIGSELARRLGWSFVDADDLHSASNKAKLHAGAPLTEEDRAPWLQAIRDDLARRKLDGADVVLACSALKRHYRDIVLQDFTRRRIVHLRGAPALIAERLEGRTDHFMAPALLGDQLSVLENPDPDEHALVVDVEGSVQALVDIVAEKLLPFINAGRLL